MPWRRSLMVFRAYRIDPRPNFVRMKKSLVALAFSLGALAGSTRTVHEYASVEYSPAIRKLGVFSTAAPNKIVDLKVVHMDKSEQDVITSL